MNKYLYVFVWMYVLISQVNAQEWNAGCVVVACLTFKDVQNCFPKRCHFYTSNIKYHQQCRRIPVPSIILHMVIIFHVSHSNQGTVIFLMPGYIHGPGLISVDLHSNDFKDLSPRENKKIRKYIQSSFSFYSVLEILGCTSILKSFCSTMAKIIQSPFPFDSCKQCVPLEELKQELGVPWRQGKIWPM